MMKVSWRSAIAVPSTRVKSSFLPSPSVLEGRFIPVCRGSTRWGMYL